MRNIIRLPFLYPGPAFEKLNSLLPARPDPVRKKNHFSFAGRPVGWASGQAQARADL